MRTEFNPLAIRYMRYFQEGKVLRVARVDPMEGLVLALYPTKNPDEFSGEAFHEIDQESERTILKREDVQDEVWLRLLDGESREGILEGYEEQYYSHYFAKRGEKFDSLKTRTFQIDSDKNEEDILKSLEKEEEKA